MKEKKFNKKKAFTVAGIVTGVLALAGVGYAILRGAKVDTESVAEALEDSLDNAADATDFIEE